MTQGTAIVVLMGVAGAGKTTVGRLLAADLGWSFHEGDDLHPTGNVEKMRRGEPLTDADRRPWLEALRRLIAGCLARGERVVVTCSALKESYRRILSDGDERVAFVHLRGDPELIAARLAGREGHFAGPELLASQLATLEEPEGAIAVDVAQPPEAIVMEIRRRLGV